MKGVIVGAIFLSLVSYANSQENSIVVNTLTGDSIEYVPAGALIKPLKEGAFVPWPYIEKSQGKLDFKDLAVSDARTYSGEASLLKKDLYHTRQALAAEMDARRLSDNMSAIKDSRITSLESDVLYWEKKSKKAKNGSRFWRTATLVVAATTGTYIALNR